MTLRAKNRLTKILELLATRFEAKSELNFKSAFECLVAVMLSPQTADKQVNLATSKLFKVASTPRAIAALSEAELANYLKTLSFYHTKAKHLKQTSEIILTKFNGKVPCSLPDLLILPGVGLKVAKVVLNSYFKQPLIAVDTHVMRVAKRLKLTLHHLPNLISSDLERLTTLNERLVCGHLLLLHGRYTCTAFKPRCNNCLIKTWCPSACA